MNNETVILPIWQCYFFEAPENDEEILFTSSDDGNETVSVGCILKSEYLFGKKIGPPICIALGVIIVIVGVIGAIGNATNVIILRFLTKSSTLYWLLMLLAVFDFLVCSSAIVTTIILQLAVNGVSREKITLRALQVSTALFSLGRTGSAYVTILVTLERFLVVTYPLHFRTWVTKWKLLSLVVVWVALIFTINSPWWLTATLKENPYMTLFPDTELATFPYLITETTFGKEVYSKIIPWDTFVDIFLPVPLLLVLNSLLFYQLYQTNKKREALTRSQTREINAARMFSKVAVILYVCNVCGIGHLIITQSTGTFHHELLHLIYISMTGNSCINFFIYYTTSNYFKVKLKKLCGYQSKATTSTSTTSKTSGISNTTIL